MGQTTRYGEDRELTRATRRAALHVAVAVAVTALFLVLSVAFVLAKFGLFAAFHGGGGLIEGGLHAVHWWGALGIFVLIVAGVTVHLLREPSDARMPRSVERLDGDHPAVQSLLRLTSLANMPVPELRVVPSVAPNAFVVDVPEHPVTICVTSGALESCTTDELEAVLAHELFHVAHGDTRLTRRLEQVADIAGNRAPKPAADYVLRAVRAMMRQRELSADRAAALLTGRPSTLVAAVERCAADESTAPVRDLRDAMLVGFVSATDSRVPAGMETHPSLQERTEVLARVARSLGS
jgi:Zn-dependent protease with chaperone function